jgi:hypothetical protein
LLKREKEKYMYRVIITAKVEDSTNWESSFRSHKRLFDEYTATAVHFTASNKNRIVILWEVTDLDAFNARLNAPEASAAMASDGVKRDSVKVYVLDKTLEI